MSKEEVHLEIVPGLYLTKDEYEDYKVGEWKSFAGRSKTTSKKYKNTYVRYIPVEEYDKSYESPWKRQERERTA